MTPASILTLVFLAPAFLDRADTDAAFLLARAEELAAKGRFGQADKLWRRIVEEAPESREAEIARQRLAPNALLRVRDLEVNGPSERRIDVFVLGDGYLRTDKHQRLFDGAAEQVPDALCQAPVFRRYRRYFNFHAMNLASAEDGIDRRGRDVDTALGAYESDAAQGQVAVRHDLVQRYLAMDPRSEGLAVVIVRLGSLGTGGGGIAVVGGGPGNSLIHEWGHAFAGLLDEYTSDVGYTGPVPRGVNVSDTPDPEKVPWRHFLEAKVKGVGVFPGAAGRSQGAWRPTASGCAMASGPSFCVVCREAVVRAIYERVSPLDEARPDPDAGVIELQRDGRVTLEAVPMPVVGKPPIEVRFTLERAREPHEAQRAAEGGTDFLSGLVERLGGDGADEAGSTGDSWTPRAGKAPDPLPPGEPLRARRRRDAQGRTIWTVTLEGARLEPGDWLVHLYVRDPTDWVLREDWRALLTDTRTWRIRVH